MHISESCYCTLILLLHLIFVTLYPYIVTLSVFVTLPLYCYSTFSILNHHIVTLPMHIALLYPNFVTLTLLYINTLSFFCPTTLIHIVTLP